MKKALAVIITLALLASCFSLVLFAEKVNTVSIYCPKSDVLQDAINSAAATPGADKIIIQTDGFNNIIRLEKPLEIHDADSITLEADNGLTIQYDKTVLIELLGGTLTLKNITLDGVMDYSSSDVKTVKKANDAVLYTENVLYILKNINGYYSVETKIAEPDEWMFLTGINEQLLDHIISLVSGLQSGETAEDEFFIDAEKIGSDDLLLCWAAAASNMFYYTGWFDECGIDSGKYYGNDALLRYFADNFTDDGSNEEYGIEWLVSGLYYAEDIDGWSQIKGDGGALFPGLFSYDYLCKSYLILGDNSALSQAENALRAGFGTALSVSFHNRKDDGTLSDENLGNHVITSWGFTYDNRLSPTDDDYITSFYITDSDDDKPYSGTVAVGDAPNCLARIDFGMDDVSKLYISCEYQPAVTVFKSIAVLLPYKLLRDSVSTCVTTDKVGMDPTDGEISLFEAMNYSEQGGGLPITFDESMAGKTLTVEAPWEFIVDTQLDASTLSKPVNIVLSEQYDGTMFSVKEGVILSMNNINIDFNDRKNTSGVSAFEVKTDATLLLTACEIIGCVGTLGGAIQNNGTVILDSTKVNNCSAGMGGAIYNTGKVTLKNSILTNNSASRKGAAIYCSGASALEIIGNSYVYKNSGNGNIFMEYGTGFTVSFSDTEKPKIAVLPSKTDDKTYIGQLLSGNTQSLWEYIVIEVPNRYIEYENGALTVVEKYIADLNSDKSTDIADAMLLFMYIAKKTELTPICQALADLNGDGRVSLVDSIQLFRLVVGGNYN